MARTNYAANARALVKKYQLPVGEVFKVTADPSAPRVSFFATGANKPCAPTKVPAACYLGQKKLTPKALKLTDPTESEYRTACKRIKGRFEPKHVKAIRAGKVDLNFLSPAQAKKVGTLPGANLRLCIRDNEPGALIPVASPDAAAALQQRFARCTGANKAKSAACAAKVAGKDAPLGALTSRRSFAGLLGW